MPNTVLRHPLGATKIVRSIARFGARSKARLGCQQSRSSEATRGVDLLPHPIRLEDDLALVVGKVAKASQNSPRRSDHHLRSRQCGNRNDGAVEHRDGKVGPGRPSSVLLAKCKACGVSRRLLNRALTPIRPTAVRDTKTTLSSCCSDLTCTIPTCQSASSRHVEYTSMLRGVEQIYISSASTSVGGEDRGAIPARDAALSNATPPRGARCH
jgi:hypothetical protein